MKIELFLLIDYRKSPRFVLQIAGPSKRLMFHLLFSFRQLKKDRSKEILADHNPLSCLSTTSVLWRKKSLGLGVLTRGVPNMRYSYNACACVRFVFAF